MTIQPVGGGFSADPFDHRNANLRASTNDREELARILSEAYAAGKLDDEEYHERLESALTIKLIGEVRPLVIDLGTPKALLRRPVPPGQARELARVEQRKQLREAIGTTIGVTVMVNAIYLVSAIGGAGFYYYWPIWPMLGMAIYLVVAISQARQAGERKALEQPPEE